MCKQTRLRNCPGRNGVTLSTLITIDNALDAVLAEVCRLPVEQVDLLDALGRTAAGDVTSGDDVPGYANSAMDGFAVRSGDGLAAGTELRVVADIPAGSTATVTIGAGEAARIMTGGLMPGGADTVVQVEHTSAADGRVRLLAEVTAGENVRPAGEDLRRGATVVRAGDVIGPAHLGLLAAAGVPRVPVARRPRVAILATGSELVMPDEPVSVGRIRNSNAYTAYGQVLEAGAVPVMLGIARDDRNETARLLGAALDEDVAITSGGVSVGDYDFVKAVQEELGVQRRFWGVRTKPGKPLAFGVKDDTLVFGFPGNPVASMTSFEVFTRPAILSMLGRPAIWRPWFQATLTEPQKGCKDRPELRRCVIEERDGEHFVRTTGPQGSGVLSSMALADGLLLLGTDFPGAEAGAEVNVMPLEGEAAERPPFPS